MNEQLLMMLPNLQPDELVTIRQLTQGMTEDQQRQFVALYRGRRQNSQTLLVLAAIGFLGVAGIQRFVVGEVGMGILYLLTLGFCGIGTIIDMINAERMSAEYNQRQAIEAANMVRMMYRS